LSVSQRNLPPHLISQSIRQANQSTPPKLQRPRLCVRPSLEIVNPTRQTHTLAHSLLHTYTHTSNLKPAGCPHLQLKQPPVFCTNAIIDETRAARNAPFKPTITTTPLFFFFFVSTAPNKPFSNHYETTTKPTPHSIIDQSIQTPNTPCARSRRRLAAAVSASRTLSLSNSRTTLRGTHPPTHSHSESSSSSMATRRCSFVVVPLPFRSSAAFTPHTPSTLTHTSQPCRVMGEQQQADLAPERTATRAAAATTSSRANGWPTPPDGNHHPLWRAMDDAAGAGAAAAAAGKGTSHEEQCQQPARKQQRHSGLGWLGWAGWLAGGDCPSVATGGGYCCCLANDAEEQWLLPRPGARASALCCCCCCSAFGGSGSSPVLS
jgi:hypothetical protein